jgi:hypothetical protein
MSFYCLFPIISYCGGISPLGGLDTAVLPAGHSTQGDVIRSFPTVEESRPLAVSTQQYFLRDTLRRVIFIRSFPTVEESRPMAVSTQ